MRGHEVRPQFPGGPLRGRAPEAFLAAVRGLVRVSVRGVVQVQAEAAPHQLWEECQAEVQAKAGLGLVRSWVAEGIRISGNSINGSLV